MGFFTPKNVKNTKNLSLTHNYWCKMRPFFLTKKLFLKSDHFFQSKIFEQRISRMILAKLTVLDNYDKTLSQIAA